jgi:hypothetical protein
MKRLLIAVVAVLGTTIVVGAAQANDPGCATPVASAPAPAPQGVAVAQQPAVSGYRTYSYQPTTGYRTYSYQPGTTNYASPRASVSGGFHDAGWKVRGF